MTRTLTETKAWLNTIPADRWTRIPKGYLTGIVSIMDMRASYFPKVELALSSDFKMVRKSVDVDWSEWRKKLIKQLREKRNGKEIT